MAIPVLISIAGTQRLEDGETETIELLTRGQYSFEPGLIQFSYTETEMTGLEGVVTTFRIEEEEQRVTLSRTGKVNSTMVFVPGMRDESLYDCGVGALLLSIRTTQLTVLLNERGGILDLEYALDLEHTVCGVNSYHIELRPAKG